jgi:hypothetical protein
MAIVRPRLRLLMEPIPQTGCGAADAFASPGDLAGGYERTYLLKSNSRRANPSGSALVDTTAYATPSFIGLREQ